MRKVSRREGRLDLTVKRRGGLIAGGVEHEAVALDDCVALEVFSPVREDYLPGS